jgi:hypothetical protein
MIKKIKRAIQRFIIKTVLDDIQSGGPTRQWIVTIAEPRHLTPTEHLEISRLDNADFLQ